MTPAQSKDILLRMVANFPGFVDDTDVNGADLVDWMANEIYALMPDPELVDRADNGTPLDPEEFEEAQLDALEAQGMTRSDAQGALLVVKMAKTQAKPVGPKCDMRSGCLETVVYTDVKGYVYCAFHGVQRKASVRCRKLTPKELKKLVKS